MITTLVLLRLVRECSIRCLGGKHWWFWYSLSIKFFSSDGIFILVYLYISLYGKVFKKF